MLVCQPTHSNAKQATKDNRRCERCSATSFPPSTPPAVVRTSLQLTISAHYRIALIIIMKGYVFCVLSLFLCCQIECGGCPTQNRWSDKEPRQRRLRGEQPAHILFPFSLFSHSNRPQNTVPKNRFSSSPESSRDSLLFRFGILFHISIHLPDDDGKWWPHSDLIY